ncbi:MAG TPA: hypothetical protein VHZ28_10290 [Terracidiphilus sp.]|jgi:hypothetical protein|nr:hypothetical protein [Terracidiphilus sp.]
MRSGLENEARSDGDRIKTTGLDRTERSGADLKKRYPLALGLYLILAVLVWFTMDAGKVMVYGKPVDLRLVPLIILGGLALRTVLALQADKIRRGGEKKD